MSNSLRIVSHCRRVSRKGLRMYATGVGPNFVKIVEVGPRDGLQNEAKTVDVAVKVALIERLANSGLRTIESGAFVRPNWVPQMATTATVLQTMKQLPGVSYPVLVPNVKGLEKLLELGLGRGQKPIVDEVAVFTAASDSFSRANTNMSVQESLEQIEQVVRLALEAKLRVRGYVSTVISCPFEGPVKPERVREVAQRLIEMGCYEVSLGDTVGTGVTKTVKAMIGEVLKAVPVDRLAVHNHDTYGMGVANVMTALEYGIRTVDSSIGGLGGCPYSPGATGNVATEDIVHALHGAGYETGVDLGTLVPIGIWISGALGRQNESRAGRGWNARWKREKPSEH